jgi:DNA polymerase I-like protein with 3'-5' exonuclease and polymerase domains
MKVAIIQKCPSNVNFNKQFRLTDSTVFNLSSEKVSRLLKKDVDLAIGEDYKPEEYDYTILVGSEALKMFTKATAVTDYSGKIAPSKDEYADHKFIATISPAMLSFKPENKPVFDQTVVNIHRILSGKDIVPEGGDYQFFTESSEIREYFATILDNPELNVIGLDSETSALACRDGYMLGISVSHKLHQGVYIDADAMDDTCCKLLQRIVDRKRTVFHNAKFDMHFFKYHLGTFFEGRDVQDTMIIHYLLDERQGTHGLKSLTMKYGTLGDYDRELDEFKKSYCKTHSIKQEDFSYDLIPWDIIKLYAAKDTDATLALYYKFYPILEANPKLLDCYYNLMLPALHFLTKMEDRGIPISKDRLELARELLVLELEDLCAELYTYKEVKDIEAELGKVFNPNSTQQLRKLLFDYIGLPPTGKLTATGAISTDAEVLTELANKHPIPKLILDIRQKTKLKNTYIDKLLPVIDRDKRVRTGFNLTSTTSGRLSSSGKFNMQQLPRDNPIIKGCVKAPEGYRIVAADLTTAEIYYAAVLSNDKNMQQVFINMVRDPKKYPDFHSNIAHMVFNLKCEPAEVKHKFPALRQAAKAISFGILYGSGPKKVAEAVNEAFIDAGQVASCDATQAKDYIETYFAKFPMLKRWIDGCHATIKAEGFIYNHFGRKRRLHNVNSKDRGIASGEIRSGFNAIIQSVSSDHLLMGAIEADVEILEKKLDVEIFALVHDSVVALVKEDQVEEYLEILIRHIQKDRGCSIPGVPIGVEQDSEPGGSRDYSCGKLDKMFPHLAAA